MKSKYKKYYRYMKTIQNIDLPYLKRTVPSLVKFCEAYNKGHKDRQDYLETEPLMIVRRLHLPIDCLEGTNHIPKYLLPLLIKISHFIGCKLVFKKHIVPFSTGLVENTVSIIGQEEEVQLCHHILQRTIIDLIVANDVLTEHYKKKNKHLFGKQKNARCRAKLMINSLAILMCQKIDAQQIDYEYHNYLLRKVEKKAEEYFNTTGYASSKSGFIDNKILTL